MAGSRKFPEDNQRKINAFTRSCQSALPCNEAFKNLKIIIIKIKYN